MLIERPPYSKCSSRKMLQICKWRMTVGNVQLHRQVGKNRWENEMRHGMRRRMESDLWNLQRKAALTLKIHLKQSRCIIHTIMTHTHIHRRQTEWLSTVRMCTHYAYAVSAKKRTWRQGQCAAEEEVQNLQSVEADALHVSLRNNPIKGSTENTERRVTGRGWKGAG